MTFPQICRIYVMAIVGKLTLHNFNRCNRFVVMANMSNILSVIIEIRDRTWLKEEKHAKKGGFPEDTKVLLI